MSAASLGLEHRHAPYGTVAELFGRATGCNAGRGGDGVSVALPPDVLDATA